MFKWIRKYRKWILAFGGVFLMIAFLAPPSIGQMWDAMGARRAVHATYDNGQKVTVPDWQDIRREVKALEQWSAMGMGIRGLDSIPTEEQWFLLVQEADEAGFISPGSAYLTADQLLNLTMQAGEGTELTDRLFGRLLGVNNMLATFLSAPQASDRRLEAFARRQFHSCRVQTVVLKAEVADDAPEPTEQEIAEQMAKYANELPGAGAMGFGYKVPNRVKVEWVEISAEAVKSAIRTSDAMTNIELRKHWQRNPNGREFPPIDSAGAAIPDAVRDDLLNTLANKRLEDIGKYAADALRMDRRSLREEGGYVVIPEVWETKRLPLATLAQRIQEEHAIDLPAYHAAGDRWLTIDDLRMLEGIGSATTDKFGRSPMSLADLVAVAREFAGVGVVPIQEGVEGPVLRSEADGSLLIFRIVDSDPEHAPRSVDEVRDAVVKDLKTLAAYRTLAASLELLQTQAREQGLLALALDHETPIQPERSVYLRNKDDLLRQDRSQFAPFNVPAYLPMPIGEHRETIEAIVDHSLTLSADTPVEQLTEAQRTFVLPVEEKLCLLVTRLVRQDPLTRSNYGLLADMGAVQMALAEDALKSVEAMKQTFSHDALIARHQFKATVDEDATEQAQTAATSDADKS